MMKIYLFDDHNDLLMLNRKLSTVGITIQQDLFGSYVAYVNEAIQNKDSGSAATRSQSTAVAVPQFKRINK